MIDFVVRHATEQDFDAVSALLEELGRPAVTSANREALLATYKRHIGSKSCESLVVERDSRVVGFLSLEFRERLNRATLEAWIPDLIVTKGSQGTGVASVLFQRAVQIAKARGCHRLTLESGDQRKRAHRFYEREGMADAGKFFTLDEA